MNGFIKNNNQIFLLLGLVLHGFLHAVTFKNEPLTNFIQPGEIACAKFPENSIVILDMESDNFDIDYDNIEKLKNLKEVFRKVKAMTGGSGSIKAGAFRVSANIVDYNSSYISGRECMDIQGKISLQFIHCLLECPLISITGNKMNFVDSFLINPEVLNINVDAPGSDYDIIQILFYDQPENPTIITGEIDLNNNQTTKRLILSNVKEIKMQFIWDRNLSEKSNTEEASDSENALEFKNVSDLENAAAVNQKSQPRQTCSQFIDKYFKKNILFSIEFIPVTFCAALFLYIAYQDNFQ